jgi:hypothetical protein
MQARIKKIDTATNILTYINFEAYILAKRGLNIAKEK